MASACALASSSSPSCNKAWPLATRSCNSPGSRLPLSAALTSSSSSRACEDRKSTRLNSSHGYISYAVFCLKKKVPDTLNRKRQSVLRVLKVTTEVANAVHSAHERGLLPLVLGGDCTITLGVTAGLLREPTD